MSAHENPLPTGQLPDPGPALPQPAPAPQAHPSPKRLAIQRPDPVGIQFVLSVLVIAVFITTFLVQAFRVPSESMEKTLLVGDFLLADKVHFAAEGLGRWLLPYRPVQRGDIVVFRYPVDPRQYFVKRVIGLPGDRIRLQDKVVFLNGAPLNESYSVHSRSDFNPYRDNFPIQSYMGTDVSRRWRSSMNLYLHDGEVLVPPDHYFVMGDNRDQSLDSRYWGFVPRGNITGRPLVIYLSLNDGGEAEGSGPNDKLFHSGQMLAHILQLARWDRMFRLVR